MAVEVDSSVQLCNLVSELTNTGKHCLQHEKIRAKAVVEEVERRAVERDDQWKRHLAESISKMRVEMEKRIEDWDKEWENHLESRLLEQAEQHEVSQAQRECMMKESANMELKWLGEQVATMQVRQVLYYPNPHLEFIPNPGGTWAYDSKSDAEGDNPTQSTIRSFGNINYALLEKSNLPYQTLPNLTHWWAQIG